MPMMNTSEATEEQVGLGVLDDDHAQALRLAMANILSTDIALFTYAQLLDGLPIE